MKPKAGIKYMRSFMPVFLLDPNLWDKSNSKSKLKAQSSKLSPGESTELKDQRHSWHGRQGINSFQKVQGLGIRQNGLYNPPYPGLLKSGINIYLIPFHKTAPS